MSRPSLQRRYEIFAEFTDRRIQETEAVSRQQRQKLMETIRLDRYLHVHPNRKMFAEEQFDFGDGPVRIRFDYRNCSPVNGEAASSVRA